MLEVHTYVYSTNLNGRCAFICVATRIRLSYPPAPLPGMPLFYMVERYLLGNMTILLSTL